MNHLPLMLLLAAPSFAAPALTPVAPRLVPQEPRASVETWLPRWFGPLPTACDSLPKGPAAIAKLARKVCEAAEHAPLPDLQSTRVEFANRGVAMSAEARAEFDYEPPSWLVVYKAEANDGVRHTVEFWPSDPRDLPGSASHPGYVVLTAWTPDGERTRAITFKLGLSGEAETSAWLVDAAGGRPALLKRPDIRRRLNEELAFWARR
ncbi:MAG: hypothetical protein HY925_11000 [Elusimicrobia bacterium]|nr:hypothetical protein [Elusimicrobiota bacterium]